jgi:hypothetical protein
MYEATYFNGSSDHPISRTFDTSTEMFEWLWDRKSTYFTITYFLHKASEIWWKGMEVQLEKGQVWKRNGERITLEKACIMSIAQAHMAKETNIKTMDAIKNLVLSFDCDDGLPESVYNSTYNLILAELGPKASRMFARSIEATDGNFYMTNRNLDPNKAEEFWDNIYLASLA